MRVVVAPDKFAGTLSAAAVAAAFADGWRRVSPGDELVLVPAADGGEGTVATLAAALGVGPRTSRVPGPLGSPVDAAWLLLPDGTAVVESAAAAGPPGPDPLGASTFGVGALVGEALDAGAARVVVGLGGTATTDGGAGFAAALGVRLLDANGQPLPPGGGALAGLASVDLTGLDGRLRAVRFVGAADVDVPLADAAPVFGPQKGASPGDVRLLSVGLERWAALVGPEQARLPGAGAAGGLGFALAALAGAQLRPGIDVLAPLLGLPEAVASAGLVVTGEGRYDAQSLRGKAPSGVARLALAAGVPCVLVAGVVEAGRRELAAAGFDAAYALVDAAPTEAEARADAARWVEFVAERVARAWSA